MAELFLDLSAEDRKDALLVAADKTGRPAYLLEKDVWVVWTLDALFDSTFGEHLVFKGGTSLSKCYGGLIQRFSEDIDLTYDIRELIPDFTGKEEGQPLPKNRSQKDKWNDAVEKRLPKWIAEIVVPHLQQKIVALDHSLTLKHDGDKVFVNFPQGIAGPEYVSPWILLEFGARSTGEPADFKNAVCDAAIVMPELTFPTATPQVMDACRTFWEKATAAHVYCLGNKFPSRFARHWSDLHHLDGAGIAAAAIADRDIADAVAEHKQCFFAAKDANGEAISYANAVGGHLRLVPEGEARTALQKDYQAMIEGGLFEVAAPSFDELMERCNAIQALANAQAAD
jgi:hypothetical protein